jgi:hypothetical protein
MRELCAPQYRNDVAGVVRFEVVFPCAAMDAVNDANIVAYGQLIRAGKAGRACERYEIASICPPSLSNSAIQPVD